MQSKMNPNNRVDRSGISAISLLAALALLLPPLAGKAQAVGEAFPAWREGLLDIHHINTGKGDAAFFILPDGTTMLVDAGVIDRPPGPRETEARPDASRNPGEWIARYIDHMLEGFSDKRINYALLTHFDTDHMGGLTPTAKASKKGDYKLTGITEVGELIPIDKMIDRAWPDYNWPKPLTLEHIANYRRFLDWQIKNRGMKVEQFQVGHNDQITLLKAPADYPGFEIRNIVANGVVWTGVGTNVRSHFPPVETVPDDLPSENMSSLGFRLSYGGFDYFTGGDLPGLPPAGSPAWRDIETPVAPAVGPVDVNVLNHHGFIDAENAFFIQTLRPRINIIQSWVAAHPSHSTLSRLQSTRLYPGPRDFFSTNMKEETKVVIGSAVEKFKSQQGHIVIRVQPGGDAYFIYILDDSSESFKIKAVHGPYESR